ncbi:MAG TPA: hypothetical protein VM577_06240 [Anaerovoracaceae bacterium]|nr:hypothetical protein [Anaerovoracaceae bacterium]
MDKKAQNQTVAVAIRVEYQPETDKLFLVFEVVDEKFKQKIKADWSQDVELKLVGKTLEEDK